MTKKDEEHRLQDTERQFQKAGKKSYLPTTTVQIATEKLVDFSKPFIKYYAYAETNFSITYQMIKRSYF